MKKSFKILGILGMSFVILSGCGSDESSNSDDKKK